MHSCWYVSLCLWVKQGQICAQKLYLLMTVTDEEFVSLISNSNKCTQSQLYVQLCTASLWIPLLAVFIPSLLPCWCYCRCCMFYMFKLQVLHIIVRNPLCCLPYQSTQLCNYFPTSWPCVSWPDRYTAYIDNHIIILAYSRYIGVCIDIGMLCYILKLFFMARKNGLI